MKHLAVDELSKVIDNQVEAIGSWVRLGIYHLLVGTRFSVSNLESFRDAPGIRTRWFFVYHAETIDNTPGLQSVIERIQRDHDRLDQPKFSGFQACGHAG